MHPSCPDGKMVVCKLVMVADDADTMRACKASESKSRAVDNIAKF